MGKFISSYRDAVVNGCVCAVFSCQKLSSGDCLCCVTNLLASMEAEAIQCLLQNNVSTIKSFVQIMYDGLRKEINDLKNENSELKYSLEYSQNEIAVLKTEVTSLKNVSKNIENNSEKLDLVEHRTRKIEDDTRIKNIRISGMHELDGETKEQTTDMVKKLIRNKLQENDIILKTAHRVGRNERNGGERQIIAKLGSASDKITCLKQSRKLKGSNIYINEDLSYATMQIRKTKLPELKAKRAAGYIAYFSGTDIVVKNRPNGDLSVRSPIETTRSENVHSENVQSENVQTENPTPSVSQRGGAQKQRGRGGRGMATRNRN